MQWIADRFSIDADGRASDLATGERVTLVIEPAGDAAAQRRWSVRCDELHRLRHLAIAPLVDYGLVGRSQRMEAWRCGDECRGMDDGARAIADRAFRFLRAMSLTTGGPHTVHAASPGPVLLPGRACGYLDEAQHDDERDVDPGIRLVDRPSIRALVDMLDVGDECRPRLVSLIATPGAGRRVAIETLARAARLRGFVPIAGHLLRQAQPLGRGRTLLIFDVGHDRAMWPRWLLATLESSRPHACITVGSEEARAMDVVTLDRLSADALASLVVPAAARATTRVQRAIERSQGWPAAFARNLWKLRDTRVRDQAPSATRAAERAATYSLDTPSESSAIAEHDPRSERPWPLPRELMTLRQRLQSATALIASGRHAPGVRLLRQTIGGLARRDAFVDAAAGSLTLARALLRRGRTEQARTALDGARDFAARAAADSLLLETAVLTAEAAIDRLRFDDAECAARAALTSSRVAGEAALALEASLALARVLFWRARYADAEAMLADASEGVDALPVLAVRRACRLARARAARGDHAGAHAALNDAKQIATGKEPDLRAMVAHASAFVHLLVGDLDIVEIESAAAVAAARQAHSPVRALTARLLQLEAERRRGRAIGQPTLDSLTRVAAAMPPLVRVRTDLLSASTDDGERVGRIGRVAASTGIAALALFAAPARHEAPAAAVDQIVTILGVCQSAEDEADVLVRVCATLRETLGAAAVAFFVESTGRTETIASAGAKMDGDVSGRAIASGIPIAPHRMDGRIEAAAPSRYGGAIIGALCARWTIGSTQDLSRATPMLVAAAAAAAPALAAALARRRVSTGPESTDLLGVTPAMVDLRRAIERAAAAPFAVLVEGESGSGKELVAKAIHRLGPRRERPFRTLNCAALPDDLVEAELFGHVRGSFTGAVADRQGVFEDAHGGTLLLDEVGELTARAQAKLLRVIQEGELRRIGESLSRRVDVRIVSATNRQLGREVDAGRFRHDLLYRLDVVRITVPPLRERRDDIALLVDHYWADAARKIASRAVLSTAARVALASYDWPGNVRELQNVLAALAVRSGRRGVVPATALPAHIRPATSTGSMANDAVWRLDAARRTFEESFVRAALVRAGGHRTRAALELGLTRQGLTKLMARLGISGSA